MALKSRAAETAMAIGRGLADQGCGDRRSDCDNKKWRVSLAALGAEGLASALSRGPVTWRTRPRKLYRRLLP